MQRSGLHRVTGRVEQNPFETPDLILKLSFLSENMPSHCIVRTQVLARGKGAGMKTGVLKDYPLSAEDDTDKMLRYLQRSPPYGSCRALGRLLARGIFYAGKNEGAMQSYNGLLWPDPTSALGVQLPDSLG